MQSMTKLIVLVFIVGLVMAAPAKRLKQQKLARNVEKIAQRYMSQDDASSLVQLASPKTDIIQALDDLATELRFERDAANNVYDNAQSQFDAAIAGNEADKAAQEAALAAAQGRLAADQAEVAATTAEISTKTSALATAGSQLEGAQSDLVVLKSNRDAAESRYNEIIAKHTRALADLGTLIGMVSNFNFDEALKQIKKTKMEFLHEKEGTVVSLMESAAALIKTADPQSRNSIKQRLIILLTKIRDGIQHSLDLYNQQEQDNRATYNTLLINLVNLIATYSTNRDSIANELANLNAYKASKEAAVIADQAAIQAAQDAIRDLVSIIAAENTEKASSTSDHTSKNNNRASDLNDIEAARQFVLQNTPGMTPAEDCNVEALDCARCLQDEHCPGNEECSAEGQCMIKPQPIVKSASVAEHQTLSVGCPAGTVITGIQFASYGTPTTTAPFRQGTCAATSSNQVVINQCLNKQSCSVLAGNEVFGDPCGGTFKQLSVSVLCVQA